MSGRLRVGTKEQNKMPLKIIIIDARKLSFVIIIKEITFCALILRIPDKLGFRKGLIKPDLTPKEQVIDRRLGVS